MVYAFDEAIGLHYLILFTKLCLIIGIPVKNYITHDSAKKFPPIRQLKRFWCPPTPMNEFNQTA